MQPKPNINRASLGTKKRTKADRWLCFESDGSFPTASFLKRNLETKLSAHSENANTVKADFGQGGAAFSRNAIAH
ncbi:hypothetical protein DW047_23300 [Phocaeicola vulgatus]|uniref:Uncharacterized protein n=1 Tax=Prevotella intermedia TaxID=28131 RepID=A0A2M8M9S6_PREIN|nr:hypothetical protein CS387_03485 [Porphyromonas gingivalis]PJF00975.1 hypothetical protein CUB97_06870 [Prevotella intermedia]RHK73066.1 hypothetical protein DW047_23300 [Phocaeicola vulgatus]